MERKDVINIYNELEAAREKRDNFKRENKSKYYDLNKFNIIDETKSVIWNKEEAVRRNNKLKDQSDAYEINVESFKTALEIAIEGYLIDLFNLTQSDVVKIKNYMMDYASDDYYYNDGIENTLEHYEALAYLIH